MASERFFNFTLVKALEEVDKEKAVELISSPGLDRKQLAGVLEDSIMGKVLNKKTGEPVKLTNEVVMKGLLNLINQIDIELKHKENDNSTNFTR